MAANLFLMALNLLDEDVVSLSQAAKELPRLRNNRPVSPVTLYRWAKYGSKSVILETAQFGGRVVTSRQAVRRFLEACAAARSGKPIPQQTQRPGPAVITVDESCRALDAAGV